MVVPYGFIITVNDWCKKKANYGIELELINRNIEPFYL